MAAVAAVAGVAGGGASVVAARLFPLLRAKLQARSLQRRIGAEDYPRAALENAVRYYVPPRCTSVDPAGRESYRAVHPAMGSLYEVLDEALYEQDPPQYLLLLADSGMGKTSALVNYYVRNLRRWRSRHPIVMLNLGRRGVLDRIDSIPDKPSTILFLDALDEDLEAVRDHRARVAELMEAATGVRAVVMSCRSQFFLRDEEITRETGVARIGPRAAGESREYYFQKIYLAPFSEREVRRYLAKRYPFWRRGRRRRTRALLDRTADLGARPLLLTYLDDLAQAKGRVEYLAEAYEAIVQAWLLREEEHVGDMDALARFSENLAVEIYSNRDALGGEHLRSEQVVALAAEWGIQLESWKLTGRSLLNRGADGAFKFAHRSIMEFLWVRAHLRRLPPDPALPWTDLMYKFVAEFLSVDPARCSGLVRNLLRMVREAPEIPPLAGDFLVYLERWMILRGERTDSGLASTVLALWDALMTRGAVGMDHVALISLAIDSTPRTELVEMADRPLRQEDRLWIREVVGRHYPYGTVLNSAQTVDGQERMIRLIGGSGVRGTWYLYASCPQEMDGQHRLDGWMQTALPSRARYQFSAGGQPETA